MNPILGIIASSISGSLNASSYESIQTVTVGAGGASSISFTSIPSIYKHLEIRAIGRSASTSNGLWLQFNGDATNSNYNAHYMLGDGSSALAGYLASTPIINYWPTSAQSSGIFGTAVISILDYTDTNKRKTVRGLGGWDANGSGYDWLGSMLWNNTAAVTSITMLMASSNNLTQYSSFALYGIKG